MGACRGGAFAMPSDPTITFTYSQRLLGTDRDLGDESSTRVDSRLENGRGRLVNVNGARGASHCHTASRGMRQFRVQGAELGYPTLCFEQVHRLPLFGRGEAMFYHDHGVSRGVQYCSHVRESMGAICITKMVEAIRFGGGPAGSGRGAGAPPGPAPPRPRPARPA